MIPVFLFGFLDVIVLALIIFLFLISDRILGMVFFGWKLPQPPQNQIEPVVVVTVSTPAAPKESIQPILIQTATEPSNPELNSLEDESVEFKPIKTRITIEDLKELKALKNKTATPIPAKFRGHD